MHPLVIEAETEVAEIVRSMRTVAVVGIKGAHKADEPAHSIPAMMVAHGLDVTGINPTLTETLGKPVLPNVGALESAVDVLDVFRRSDAIPELAEQILAMPADRRPRTVWLQTGIRHDESAEKLAEAGIKVVQDRCLGVYLKRYA